MDAAGARLAAALRPDLTQWRRIRTRTMADGMVESAAAARAAGDWRAAAVAARADVDIDLVGVRDRCGAVAAAVVEDDLQHLALDLLWWHLPRHRGGMTTLQARISAVLSPPEGGEGPVIRVRLPLSPTGPQRLALTVVSVADLDEEERWYVAPRYTWDVRAAAGLRAAWGGSGDRPPLLTATGQPLAVDELGVGDDGVARTERIYRQLADAEYAAAWRACNIELTFDEVGHLQHKGPPTCPVGLAEQAREVGRAFSADTVGTVHSAHLELTVGEPVTAVPAEYVSAPPRILAMPVPADLVLIFAGLQTPDQIHPLMRSALFPAAGQAAATPASPARTLAGSPVRVRCGGDWHEVAVTGGALRLPRHSAEELQREQVVRALGGASTGCFAAREQWTTGATRLARGLADQRREVRLRMQHGDTDWVLDGLARGVVDPHLRDSNGWSLMHMAMWVEYERLLPVLVAHGVPVDARDRIGRTPLYVAVMSGAPSQLVRWFLAAGADPFAETVHGASPVYLARYRRWRSDLGFLADLRR